MKSQTRKLLLSKLSEVTGIDCTKNKAVRAYVARGIDSKSIKPFYRIFNELIEDHTTALAVTLIYANRHMNGWQLPGYVYDFTISDQPIYLTLSPKHAVKIYHSIKSSTIEKYCKIVRGCDAITK